MKFLVILIACTLLKGVYAQDLSQEYSAALEKLSQLESEYFSRSFQLKTQFQKEQFEKRQEHLKELALLRSQYLFGDRTSNKTVLDTLKSKKYNFERDQKNLRAQFKSKIQAEYKTFINNFEGVRKEMRRKLQAVRSDTTAFEEVD